MKNWQVEAIYMQQTCGALTCLGPNFQCSTAKNKTWAGGPEHRCPNPEICSLIIILLPFLARQTQIFPPRGPLPTADVEAPDGPETLGSTT